MPIVAYTGFRAAVQFMADINRRFTDVTPALHALRHLAANASKDAFARQRDPVDNTRWPELSAWTEEAELEDGSERGPGNILNPRGRGGYSMKASIRTEAKKNELRIGSNKVGDNGFPYPATHQFGTRPGKRPRVPQRRFMGFSTKLKGEIMSGCSEYVLTGRVNGKRVGRRRSVGGIRL